MKRLLFLPLLLIAVSAWAGPPSAPPLSNNPAFDSVTIGGVDVMSAIDEQYIVLSTGTLGTPTYLEITAGSSVSTSVTAGTYYIDPDMDIWVTNDSASGLYGVTLDDDTDMIATTPGSLAAETGLDIGVDDFTFEFWVSLAGMKTTNINRVFSAGSSTLKFEVYLFPKEDLSTAIGGRVYLTDGETDFNPVSIISDTGVLTHDALVHAVFVVDRAGSEEEGKVEFWVDGQKISEKTDTENVAPADIDISSIDSDGIIVVGGTLGMNAEWDGAVYDVKVYKGHLMTQTEIQASNTAGPARAIGQMSALRDADAALSWWLSFQNSAEWADPQYPENESGYGNAVFNNFLQTPTLGERSEGSFPSPTNGTRIRAGSPRAITLETGYLNIHSTSATAGSVQIVEITE